MQTLTIHVKDEFMNEVMKFIEIAKDNIVVQKDENLEYDKYFYERQKQLQQIRDDIKNGKIESITQKQYDHEMEQFFKKLEAQSVN